LSCYACDCPATTDEHVPPLCLFPERRDSPGGRDLRRNLITVPSCEAHNTRKSLDDVYFLWVLSTNLPANATGAAQVQTKLARAHRRRPALGSGMLMGAKDVTVLDSVTGKQYDAMEVALDGPRFQRVLDLVVLGLHRHHFHERWLGGLRVHADFVAFPDVSDADAVRVGLFAAAEKLFASEPKHGDNPDVFWYKAFDALPAARLFRLCFYGACTATAILQPVER